MKLLKNVKRAVVAAMLCSAGFAHATVLQFNITGDYTASWQLDSDLVPDIAAPREGFTLREVAGSFPTAPGNVAQLTFWGVAYSGGLSIVNSDHVILVSTNGPQLFTGSSSDPDFTLGTFALTSNRAPGEYILTIAELAAAEVPEPATGALLLGGLGLIYSLRKRQSQQA